MKQKPTSIFSQLLLASVLVVLVPALIISMTSAWSGYQIGRQRTLAQLESVVTLKSAEIDMWTNNLNIFLDTLLSEREIGETVLPLLQGKLSPADARQAHDLILKDMNPALAKTQLFTRVLVTDVNGRVIASTDPAWENRDLSSTNYYQQGLQKDYVTPPIRASPQDQRLIIAAVHPITWPGQGAVGVLVGYSDLAALNRIMAEPTGLGQTGESYLVGADFAPLTSLRFQTDPPITQVNADQGVRLALENKVSGHGLYSDYRKVGAIGAYSWLPTLQVALVVEQDQAEAFRSIITMLITDLGIALAAVLVTLVIASIVARSIATPLHTLSTTATRIASGELEQVAGVKRRDEIGNLAQAFNHMTGQLRALIKQLQAELAERKQAEQALSQSEERYRGLVEFSPDAIFIERSDGRIVFINKAGLDLFGATSQEQIVGKQIMDLIHPEYRAVLAERFQQVSRQKMEMPLIEEKYVRLDGSFVDAEVAAISFEYEGELHVQVIARDITERKQAEDDLHKSEEKFRKAFVISPDSININRLKDGLYIAINNGFTQIMGYSEAESVGKTSLELNIWADPADRQRLVDGLLKNGEVVNLEARFLAKNGNIKYGLMSASLLELNNIPHIISITRDITERKWEEELLAQQAEELRQRNNELNRLYRASGSLISGASLNLQELAQKIVEVIQQDFGMANCSLIMIQKDSNELARLAIAGAYADQVKNKKLSLDGPGLVAQAIQLGKMLNVGNVRSTPDYVPNWEAAQSELAIPLMIGDNVIGVIDVQSSEADAFGPDDERLMTVFVERAALALEHSRLNAQTDLHLRRLMALRTIDMTISSSFDLSLTLGVLLDQVTRLLGVHAVDILAFNASTQAFKFSSERGFHTHTLQQTQLRFGAGYPWRVVRERQMLVVRDVRAEAEGLQRTPDISDEQFVSYVGIPLVAKGLVKGILEVFNREPLELDMEAYAFLEMLAGQAAIAIDNSELFEHLQSSNAELGMAYDSTLEGWANALELRDEGTEGHTRRVAELATRLAQALGIRENDILQIYRGAMLHDIGKMGVPDSIVLKPGPLTEKEWAIMRKHPQYAYDMLSSIAYLRPALDIPYCHHEKWDGTGYPRGLKGGQIPMSARLFAIVDVWDALNSDRPYRKAWLVEKTHQYIQEQAGLHFDPEVVKAFLNPSFLRE